jgi:SAM-dependent methyltransferase
MSSFSREYSEIYDLLYEEKDYQGEVSLIEEAIRRYKPDSRKILDYGCGTGRHAGVMAARGYEISGIDKNENMLAVARQRLKDWGNARFYNAGERSAIGPGSIDVCVTLFDVLSYMNTNEEIRDFLAYVKDVLTHRGLFVFDFWYGPGVINLRPEKRWKERNVGDRKILRLTDPAHDNENCIVSVTHETIISEKDRIINRIIETHNMRYFFKNEVFIFLSCNGFEALNFGTWKDLYAPPTITDWSALVVAKKS